MDWGKKPKQNPIREERKTKSLRLCSCLYWICYMSLNRSSKSPVYEHHERQEERDLLLLWPLEHKYLIFASIP